MKKLRQITPRRKVHKTRLTTGNRSTSVHVGSTTRACDLAREHKKVIILQPTKELITKTVATELLATPKPPLHCVLTQDTVPAGYSVTAEAIRFFNAAEPVGQILFLTHQVLPHIPFIANKREWHLLVDEEMQILHYKAHRIPDTHNLLTDHLELQAYNSVYSLVVPRSRSALEKLGRNKDDDEILAGFSETARILTNEHSDTFVNTEQYARLLKQDNKTLSFHSILKPSIIDGFGSVFMAAANFEDTALYQLWADTVRFGQDREFAKSLRYTEHQNGHLITIYYGIESAWSKRLADKKAGADDCPETIRERLIAGIKNILGDATPFLCQGNKGIPDNVFGPNAIRLPNKPHGLNGYANIDNIALLSHLNPRTDHFRFLESRGVSSFDVRKAVYFSTIYQSVMRTSIREPDNANPKTIVVPDRDAAEYLQSKFPGAKVQKLDISVESIPSKQPGRPRRHTSNAARVAEQRRRTKEKRLTMLSGLWGLQNSQDALMKGWEDGDGNSTRYRAENTIQYYRGFRTSPTVIFQRLESPFESDFNHQPCAGTMYPDKFAPLPSGYMKWWDADTFSCMLLALHQRTVLDKESCFLFSPSVFNPKKCEGADRGKENIVYVQNVWLDFEDGDLKPDEFAKLFPHTMMIITNTYHHTAEKPRFRVAIPTIQPVTADAYEALFDGIADKLEDAGYTVNRPKRGRKKKINSGKPRSGLDWSKRNATSLFYLPSQAQYPSQSFFSYYNEPERFPLDPLPWIENSQIPIQPEMHSDWSNSAGRDIDETRVQRAKQEWRATPKGHGNDAFFRLALECKRAGMSLGDIEAVLREEAQYAHSPRERRQQITGILKTLKGRPIAA